MKCFFFYKQIEINIRGTRGTQNPVQRDYKEKKKGKKPKFTAETSTPATLRLGTGKRRRKLAVHSSKILHLLADHALSHIN